MGNYPDTTRYPWTVSRPALPSTQPLSSPAEASSDPRPMVARLLRLLLVAVLCLVGVAAKKRGAAAAIPRKKSARRQGRPFGAGFVQRMFRELKSSFVSELEAVTLQLTRPVDQPVPSKPLEELVMVLSTEYENPQFLVTVLAKLSRKMTESNIFTKLKALYTLHKLMTFSSDDTQTAIMQCMLSLRTESDGKVDDFFFSMENIEALADSAVNVAELETAEFTREYATYVLDYIDAKGDKSSMKEGVLDRAEILYSLLNQGIKVESKCKATIAGAVLKQCVGAVLEERKWILKQLVKLYEVSYYTILIMSLL